MKYCLNASIAALECFDLYLANCLADMAVFCQWLLVVLEQLLTLELSVVLQASSLKPEA